MIVYFCLTCPFLCLYILAERRTWRADGLWSTSKIRCRGRSLSICMIQVVTLVPCGFRNAKPALSLICLQNHIGLTHRQDSQRADFPGPDCAPNRVSEHQARGRRPSGPDELNPHGRKNTQGTRKVQDTQSYCPPFRPSM